MGLSDGNLSYGSVKCYITSNRDQGDLSNRSPICLVYTCMYLRMHIHGCICMRVCGCGLSKVTWIARNSRGGKRAQDRYSEMDVCT